MKEFLTRAFALTFTASIHKRLCAPKSIGMGTPYRSYQNAVLCGTSYYRAEGQLSLCTHSELGETTVPVTILVHPEWMTIPPISFCHADFMRREIDWHIQCDGSMCQVLSQQWRWQLGQWWEQGLDISHLADNAAAWSCQNIDSLITRHLHGHRFGLTKWPKQWRQ